MGRRIFTTVGFTCVCFLAVALLKFLTGDENWFMEAFIFAIPAGFGHFMGYREGREGEKQENR